MLMMMMMHEENKTSEISEGKSVRWYKDKTHCWCPLAECGSPPHPPHSGPAPPAPPRPAAPPHHAPRRGLAPGWVSGGWRGAGAGGRGGGGEAAESTGTKAGLSVRT